MSDILDTASFDQFTDFKTVDEIINSKSRIIFSAEAYEHFLRLKKKKKNSQSETGCFFLGKEQGKDYLHQRVPAHAEVCCGIQ